MDINAQFDQSFERVVQKNGKQFFTTFYQIFTDKSELVKAAFAKTDMAKQKKMLEDSLLHLVAFSLTRQVSSPLDHIAKVHANLHIGVNLYDLWMDSLIESLAKTDPDFSNKDAIAWRVILSPGVEYMKTHMRPDCKQND